MFAYAFTRYSFFYSDNHCGVYRLCMRHELSASATLVLNIEEKNHVKYRQYLNSV